MAEPTLVPAPALRPSCCFQELFFHTELKRDSALPGASAERKVYIVRRVYFSGASALARQGHCPAAWGQRCSRWVAAERLRGCHLSPGVQECCWRITARSTLAARQN